LCFVRNKDDILLIKRGPKRRVFPNQFNGIGGHIERNEDPYTGARREILEETGLEVVDLQLRGVHNIDAGAASGIMLFVFTAMAVSREFADAGIEGNLRWVPTSEISQLDLVEDLPYILPMVLQMHPDAPPYFAYVSYDEKDSIVMKFTNINA
jgi:8-oxo-dGTP diphosphatase